MPATKRVKACSLVRLNSPGSRSFSSPGWQSASAGAAVADGLAALDVDRVRVVAEVVGVAVDDRVSHGGGVVGSVSDELDEEGPATVVDKAGTVAVVSVVCVS